MTQNKNYRAFAQILRAERERRCWTQAQVAEKVNTSPVNVSRWERDISKPGPYHRQQLCEAFGLSPEEFHFLDPSNGQENDFPGEEQLFPSTFHFNEPLLDLVEFYGRRRECVTLRSRLLKRSSTSIVGSRRIGKSWLLTYVKLLIMRDFSQHISVCYFDAGRPSCRSVQYFLQTVLRDLEVPIPQASLSSTSAMLEDLEHLVCRKVERQQILVLCIDEFEGLCTTSDFQLSFLEHLRALANIGLVLITVSKRPLLTLISEVFGEQGKTSPFFNIFEQLLLKPFEEYEAQRFVMSKSIQASFQQQESAMLLRYGQIASQQWHPLRLQLVGKMLEMDKYLARYEDAGYYRPDDAEYWKEFEQRLEEAYRGVIQ